MDENHPPPPVTLVRAYKKQPPPLEIPSLDSIRALGTSSSTDSPTAPSLQAGHWDFGVVVYLSGR